MDTYEVIGRQNVLEQYERAWKNKCRIFGFYGMTKVGKTRLCAEFIKRLKDVDDLNITDYIFDLKDIHSYHDFAELLCLKFNIESGSLLVRKEKIIKHMKNNTDTLFVFVLENLEEAMPKAKKDGSNPDKFDETLWDQLYQNIVECFLNSCKNVYFCLTSCTWAKFAGLSKISHLQAIPPLCKTDSVTMLKEVLKDRLEDEECLETIAELCDGLPGSIVNVGTDMTLHSQELTNQDVVAILIDRKLQALSGEFLPASVKIENSVSGMIRKLSKEKQENLKVLAASGPGLNVASGAHAFDYQKEALFKFDVLIPLKYRSLVETDRKSKDISVHPITQEFMKIHHASVTSRDKEIARKVQKFIEDYCNKVDPDKSPELKGQLKDYHDQGFPECFEPTAAHRESVSVPFTGNHNVETRSDINVAIGGVHTSAGIPRLNDLSPATSTEKEDKGFEFKCNTNLHASLEQKPSLRKEIVYSGPANGITIKSESGNKTVLNSASDSDRCLNSNQTVNILSQPKRLTEAKMNLGCSIEENDRITITPERRLSEIVKRNNLSRSLSAQGNICETKSNNLSRALTVQESCGLLQQKRSTLSRSNAFEVVCDLKSNCEYTGDVKWDDCSGSSQNITSDENRNSSCERNDSYSLEDNVNVDVTQVKSESTIYNQNNNNNNSMETDIKKYANNNENVDPLIVRPKEYQSITDDGNSLKRLLYSQVDHSESYKSETFMKEPCKEAVENSLGPSLNPASLLNLDSDLSKHKLDSYTPLGFDSLCDNTRNSLPLTPRCSLKKENTDKKEESLPFSTFSQISSQTSNTSRVPNRAEKLKMLLEKTKKKS